MFLNKKEPQLSVAGNSPLDSEEKSTASDYSSSDECALKLNKLSVNSALFIDNDRNGDNQSGLEVPVLEEQYIEFGGVLGSGGFSSVRELRGLKRQRGLSEGVDIMMSRAASLSLTRSMHSHCSIDDSSSICNSSVNGGYAIKQLRKDLSRSSIHNGAIDLAVEARFLTALSHRNIISLHCVSESSPGNKDFFIVIDRIDRTLGKEIVGWRRTQERVMKEKSRRGKEYVQGRIQSIYNSRVAVAIEIAQAMEYLHLHKIIYRDIKPENIGLDYLDVVKIFDFGCAKELKEEQKIGHNQYLSTARVGTRRYMAPEVYLGQSYGLPVDVYSFSILLWEILSLTSPFENFTSLLKHANAVYKKHRRPHMGKSWPKVLKTILESGWHKDPSRRASMDEICEVLKNYLAREDSQ